MGILKALQPYLRSNQCDKNSVVSPPMQSCKHVPPAVSLNSDLTQQK